MQSKTSTKRIHGAFPKGQGCAFENPNFSRFSKTLTLLLCQKMMMISFSLFSNRKPGENSTNSIKSTKKCEICFRLISPTQLEDREIGLQATDPEWDWDGSAAESTAIMAKLNYQRHMIADRLRAARTLAFASNSGMDPRFPCRCYC